VTDFFRFAATSLQGIQFKLFMQSRFR